MGKNNLQKVPRKRSGCDATGDAIQYKSQLQKKYSQLFVRIYLTTILNKNKAASTYMAMLISLVLPVNIFNKTKLTIPNTIPSAIL